MKRKILKIMMVALIVVLIGSTVFAADVIRVQQNGKFINFEDVDPQIVNDRTMVPMRKIFEEFGMTVEWEAETRTVTAKNDEKIITLTIGKQIATVGTANLEKDGLALIELDTAPLIINDRTMVPVRFIAESLGKQVGWDAENRCVIIIDYSELENKIKESSPAFYELMKTESVDILSMSSTTELSGKLSYTDMENKSGNGTIGLDGKLNIDKNEEAFKIELDLEFDETGSFKDMLGVSELKFDVIVDVANGVMYVKSPELEKSIGNKWAKTIMPEEFKKIIELSKNGTNVSLGEVLSNQQLEIDINTYAQLERVFDIICKLSSPEYFSVSGSSSKTCTWKVSMKDLLSIINDLSEEKVNENQITELLEIVDAKIVVKSVVKDGVATKSTIEIEGSYTESTTKEKIKIACEVITKLNSYNKYVSISMPKASQVEDVSEY